MKVIKNYLYNAGYQILIMLAPLITTPYVSRVLGPHNNGIYAYTTGWVTFFYLIGQLGITMYGNREISYNRDDPIKRSQTFWGIESLQLMTVFLTLIAYIVIVFLFSTTFREYFLIQSVWIVAAAFDVSWYFMGLEDFKRTVTRNTIVKLLSILMIFTFVKQESDLWKYILLLDGASLVGNLTLWPYLPKTVRWVPIKTWHPWKHFYPSLLLFVPTVTTQVYLVVNRLMLGRMSTQTALGQFDYADRLVKLVIAIVTASGTVMLPHIASKYAKGQVKEVRKSLYIFFDFSTAIAIPMMFGMMAISAKMTPWFLGNKYIEAGKIVFYEAPVILFISWSTVTGNQYLIPINRVREYTVSVTIGAVVNVISNLVLIYLWGVNGAAIASVLSEFSVAAYQLFCIRGTIRRRQLFSSLWKYFLAGIIMFVVVYRMDQYMSMNIIHLIVQVAAGIILYLIGIITLRAPIVHQALQLIANRRGNKE
ncbi:flippase [Limosilactobacillus sp.]|uniref:flippase n=1 Tax=Limosilactobacillus sp. TaxID=2773925 RepID=UPI00345E8513